MKQLGTIPIYFPTNDKRVQAYLRKNVTHHQLYLSRNGIPETKEGVGPIRQGLFLFFIAVAIYTLAVMWGLV